jgi:PAS domain-containing protein
LRASALMVISRSAPMSEDLAVVLAGRHQVGKRAHHVPDVVEAAALRAVAEHRSGCPARALPTTLGTTMPCPLAQRGRAVGAGTAAVAGLARAFSASPVAMAVVSLSGRVVRINAAVRDLLGRGSREPSGRPVSDLIHPDDRAMEDERGAPAPRTGDRRPPHASARARRRLARADARHRLLAADDAGRGLCVVWFVAPAVRATAP